MKNKLAAPALLVCLYPFAALAQDSSELLARMQAMEERIKALEAEVLALKGQPAAAPAPTVAQAPPAQPPAPPPAPAPAILGGAGPAAAKVLNPDIAVIGDFVGAAGNSAGQPVPSFEMHESEVAFQAILDPYARADFFISFGEHGVDLEEGYVTFPALPGGFQLRAGKMLAAFGTVNTLHNHVLPWIDRPLVTNNLIGGEDGIDDAGLSLSRIIPAPKQIFLEATAQVFHGDSNLFHAYNRDSISPVGHLRAYRDISESTNVNLGVSYVRGHSPIGPDVINELYGIDATVRWKPLRRAIYHSFVGRSEYVWSRIEQPGLTRTPTGYFVSGEYQFARRWFAGGRFDRSERLGLDHVSLLQDTGGSLLLTYWPSEFSQVRGQLRRTQYGENLTANEFIFQFVFSIGAHGAHPF